MRISNLVPLPSCGQLADGELFPTVSVRIRPSPSTTWMCHSTSACASPSQELSASRSSAASDGNRSSQRTSLSPSPVSIRTAATLNHSQTTGSVPPSASPSRISSGSLERGSGLETTHADPTTRMVQQFADFMDSLSIATLVVMVLVSEPLAAFVHELGHGIVAVTRVSGDVRVKVGGMGPLVQWSWGRLAVGVSPLVIPGHFGGHCTYEGRTSSRADRILIALGGPAASLVFGLLLWMLDRSLFASGAMHRIAAITAFVSVGSGLICLVPLKLTDSRGRTLPTDGAQALAAFASR